MSGLGWHLASYVEARYDGDDYYDHEWHGADRWTWWPIIFNSELHMYYSSDVYYYEIIEPHVFNLEDDVYEICTWAKTESKARFKNVITGQSWWASCWCIVYAEFSHPE